MHPQFSSVIPNVIQNHISVKAAAEISGYNIQYLRRMLRLGRLPGVKVGQVWLIDKWAFDEYMNEAQATLDRRFGAKEACYEAE